MEGKLKMVKVQVGEHNYYLDGYLKSNLDVSIKEVKRKNYDKFVLITGREGAGKTTFASQCALYCDPTFNLDRIYFTPEQFLEGVENAEKFTAHVFDETMWSLGSRSAITKMNRVLIKIISEMRSKNLFVFMCIPNFFSMDWYISLHRSTGLLYVYKRSFFASYDYPTKKKLWMNGKKTHSYKTPPNFKGRFTKYFSINQEEYDKKKNKAINSWIKHKGESEKTLKYKDQRNILIRECIKNKTFSTEELSKLIDLSPKEVGVIVQREEGI
jgi:energy-coupling factor transporter ATP-binding protein EcfA2